MDHKVFSGIVWITFAIFLVISGISDVMKKGDMTSIFYIVFGLLILLFQLYLYKKTGKVGGIL